VDIFFFTNRYESTVKAASILAGNEPLLLAAAARFVARGTYQHAENCPSNASDAEQTKLPNLMISAASFPEEREINFGSFKRGSFLHENPSMHRQEELADLKAAIAEIFCACNRTISYGDLWINLITGQQSAIGNCSVNWKNMFKLIDHRRLASFALVHGLLERVHCFPLIVDPNFSELEKLQLCETRDNNNTIENDAMRERIGRVAGKTQDSAAEQHLLKLRVAAMMNGQRCDDELVCIFERPLEQLLELMDGKRVVSTYATLIDTY
jgi:hypothetical protein